MTIKETGYKELFLLRVEQGYDAAFGNLNRREENDNPYSEYTERYEHEAWETGYWWYASEVH